MQQWNVALACDNHICGVFFNDRPEVKDREHDM